MSRNWGEGQVIMDRYRLVSLLGSGGMGSVWRAEHLQLKSDVAVKLLDPTIAGDEQVVARFIREARAAAALRNRHVVQIFDYGVEDGNAFIVMEMLHGETLGARIDRLGKLSVEDAIKFMCQVMRAIGRAHEIGIVHRDLKPENIFLCSDDDGEYAKVLDFGVAKVESGALEHSAGVKTQTGMMIGTPFYMSPEQAKARPVDHRADIWALAVITYECLTGNRPFTGTSFADLVISVCSSPIPLPSNLALVPRGFDEWFVRGTQRDVEKRFKSTRDMASELLQLAHAPLVGRRSSAPELGGETLAGGPGPVRSPAVRQRTSDAPPERGRPSLGRVSSERLDLTTGQRSATGYDTERRRTGERASGRGSWVWITAALAFVGVAGLAVFLLRPTAEAEEAIVPAAVPEAPLTPRDAATVEAPRSPSRQEPPVSEPEAPPEPAATAERAVEPTKKEQGEAARAADKTKSDKTFDKAADKAADKTKSTPSTSGVSEPSSATGKKVPVVDKSSLPPTEWEF